MGTKSMLTDGWLGRYKIISKIGSGGMGEVYLCEDPKLGRRIALKTLPADVAKDSGRMHRFIAEAKSASALNHPNIITIYEIDDANERPFIAMEYVKGDTLGRLIKKGPIALATILDVAIQVAGALSAAHEANIVHRDIKPDNIIVRPDGLVKVLDFGLAKLTENDGTSDPEAETIAHRTNPGMILGTASYMSPEQARGKDIDGRSDIFSFGTVLFQMLTGKLPFVGENYVDVIGSILYKEPILLSSLDPNVPHDIESMVRKCLRKNRDERYQSVPELLADLKEIRQDLGLELGSYEREVRVSDPDRRHSTGDDISRPMTTAGNSVGLMTSTVSKFILDEFRLHPIRLVAALLIGFGALVVAGTWITKRAALTYSAEAFQRMRFTRVTSTGNIVSEQLALSPDGKYIAYVASDEGSESIWVKQSAIESNVRIVHTTDLKYRGLAFTPDANHIYYTAIDASGLRVLYQIPVLGGAPRKVITDVGQHLAFSPQGDRFSFVRSETALMIANSDGGGIRTLAPASPGDRWLVSAWSPDSTKIAAAVFSAADSNCRLFEVDVATGAMRPISGDPWLRISGLNWLPDESGLMLTGRDLETEISQVWFVSYPDGATQRITNDLSNYLGLSVSADGRTIASVKEDRLSNIWTAGTDDDSAPVRVTRDLARDDGMSGVAWTADGRIVYTVRTRGKQDLWIVNPDGTGERQLTDGAGSNFSPAASPDGRYVVFVSTRSGSPDLWRMDVNGENALPLTAQQGIENEPEITPDGQWIIYERTDLDQQTAIWKVSINSGEPVQLTTVESSRPEVSPDGRFFACSYGEFRGGRTPQLAVIPIEGGEPISRHEMPKVLRSRNFRWSADGKGFVYIDTNDKVDNIWLQPLVGGSAQQLTNFTSDGIKRFDIAKDTGRLAFARFSESSDIVMISDFR